MKLEREQTLLGFRVACAPLVLRCAPYKPPQGPGAQPRPRLSAYKAHVFGITAMNFVNDGSLGFNNTKVRMSRFPAEFLQLN